MTARSRRKRKHELRKRGRPFVDDPAPRTANGRLSRARVAVVARTTEYEHEVVSVAVKARMRATGLPEAVARQPIAGSALGLLRLDGKLDVRRIGKDGRPYIDRDWLYDAGSRYAEDMSRYYGLTGIPFPSPRAQNLFLISRGSGGDESPDKIAAARVASNRAMQLEHVLATCSDHPNAPKSCCMAVCVMNEMQARDWPPATIGYLRRGLSALANWYGGKNG